MVAVATLVSSGGCVGRHQPPPDAPRNRNEPRPPKADNRILPTRMASCRVCRAHRSWEGTPLGVFATEATEGTGHRDGEAAEGWTPSTVFPMVPAEGAARGRAGKSVDQ